MKHYQTLGVPDRSDVSELRRAYKELSLQHHPDKGGDVAQFKKISEAYEFLINDEKRKEYDMYGDEGKPPQQQYFGANSCSKFPMAFPTTINGKSAYTMPGFGTFYENGDKVPDDLAPAHPYANGPKPDKPQGMPSLNLNQMKEENVGPASHASNFSFRSNYSEDDNTEVHKEEKDFVAACYTARANNKQAMCNVMNQLMSDNPLEVKTAMKELQTLGAHWALDAFATTPTAIGALLRWMAKGPAPLKAVIGPYLIQLTGQQAFRLIQSTAILGDILQFTEEVSDSESIRFAMDCLVSLVNTSKGAKIFHEKGGTEKLINILTNSESPLIFILFALNVGRQLIARSQKAWECVTQEVNILIKGMHELALKHLPAEKRPAIVSDIIITYKDILIELATSGGGSALALLEDRIPDILQLLDIDCPMVPYTACCILYYLWRRNPEDVKAAAGPGLPSKLMGLLTVQELEIYTPRNPGPPRAAATTPAAMMKLWAASLLDRYIDCQGIPIDSDLLETLRHVVGSRGLPTEVRMIGIDAVRKIAAQCKADPSVADTFLPFVCDIVKLLIGIIKGMPTRLIADSCVDCICELLAIELFDAPIIDAGVLTVCQLIQRE